MNRRASTDPWTCVVMDREAKITEVTDPDSRLFFGKQLRVGQTLSELIGEEQSGIFTDAIRRALNEERRVFTEYRSCTDGVRIPVCAHFEPQGDGSVCLYAIAVDPEDLRRVRESAPESKSESLLQTVYDNLPLGAEVYDHDGRLLQTNPYELESMGVKHMSDILGINLFDNPNLPTEIAQRLRAGENVRFTTDYDFDLARSFYKTTKSSTCKLDISISVIRTASGAVDKYLLISQNVTDRVRMEEALRQSQRKMQLAIQASDIMIWEFDVKRQIFMSENDPLNGYDPSQPVSIQLYIDTLHPDDQQKISGIMGRMVAGEDWSFSEELRILFPGSDQWQYCTVSGSPYERDANGKVIRFVGARKNNTDLQKRKLFQDNILNSLPLAIHIKDIQDNFRYVFCNDESKRMFGTTEDATTEEVMDALQVQRIQKTDLEVYISGTPYLGLEHIELKDGRSYDVIVRKGIIYDDGKRLLLSMRWDKSQEIDLERRAKVLSMSMEVMNAYTWFFEPGRGRVSFGEGFERTGRDPELYNTLDKFLEAVHPEDRKLFADSIESLIPQGNGEWAVEYRVDLSNTGHYEWWETRGILETTTLNDAPYPYIFGMSVNIEAHKQTELTLRRNKEKLNNLIHQNQLVLNNTNSGLAYITPDYIVQWENISKCSASLTYEAYRQGELCFKSAHGRSTPCENCVMQRALKSHQTEQIKFELDGRHTVEVFATPVFSAENTLDGIVIRVDDVTQRERMIAELKQAKTLAEQSDKLKSAFLANMSHEIRTPLNAIVGFSELLISAGEEEDRNEYIRIINSNNELLLKLINDILDLSKIEAGSVELRYEEFDLADYFDGLAASMRQRVVNTDVELTATNPYAVCKVTLDKNRIAQILSNYVTNAIKYTPSGFIRMGYECTGDGVRFWVRDSGIGIADEKKPKVFHRFEKLDQFAQGTGLGLSICKAIAESMGGSVGFESNQGEGSLFWAFLPCEACVDGCPEEFPETLLAEAPPICTGKERKTILIAEDIPSNYLLISALLRKDFDLLHATNGREAVEMARTREADLVLMDMKMPELDGLTATALIREFDQAIPIVALTAHAFEADRVAALKAGCNDYLVKPIDKTALTALLRKYCGDPPAADTKE